MFQNIILPHYRFKFQFLALTVKLSGQQISLHQVALTTETQKLVHFVVGNEQYKYKRGFCGLKGLPGFFTRKLTILFAQLIKLNENTT